MSIPRVNEPLGRAAPYIVPSYGGESMSLPGTKSVVRILASSKETEDLMSVFKLDGVAADPVGFHYHNFAHDIFLCIKGEVKIWFGDQCRLLHPGDFASVPPVRRYLQCKISASQCRPATSVLINDQFRKSFTAHNHTDLLKRQSAL